MVPAPATVDPVRGEEEGGGGGRAKTRKEGSGRWFSEQRPALSTLGSPRVIGCSLCGETESGQGGGLFRVQNRSSLPSSRPWNLSGRGWSDARGPRTAPGARYKQAGVCAARDPERWGFDGDAGPSGIDRTQLSRNSPAKLPPAKQSQAPAVQVSPGAVRSG